MHSEAEGYSNMIAEAVTLSPSSQQFLSQGRVVVVKSQSVSLHELLKSVRKNMYMDECQLLGEVGGNVKPGIYY